MYVTFGHHPHPLGYLFAKFCFFCNLHCWASLRRKLRTQSINHSVAQLAYLMPREPIQLKLLFRNEETLKKELCLAESNITDWCTSVTYHATGKGIMLGQLPGEKTRMSNYDLSPAGLLLRNSDIFIIEYKTISLLYNKIFSDVKKYGQHIIYRTVAVCHLRISSSRLLGLSYSASETS